MKVITEVLYPDLTRESSIIFVFLNKQYWLTINTAKGLELYEIFKTGVATKTQLFSLIDNAIRSRIEPVSNLDSALQTY